jgi:excisionase family DNA binding protein
VPVRTFAPGPAGPPVMHTAEEAARLLKVKQSWLERQAAARKIPFTMLGGSYRFSDRHLAEIVRMNEVMPSRDAKDVRPPERRHRTASAASAGATETEFEPLRPRPCSGPRHVALSEPMPRPRTADLLSYRR